MYGRWSLIEVVISVVPCLVLVGAPFLLLALGYKARLASRNTRRWVRRELGVDTCSHIEVVHQVLADRNKARGWGGLTGLILAGALAPPDPADDYLVANLGLWITGLLVGTWWGASAQAVGEVRAARSPDGVRVAASVPHRLGWYVAPAAALLLGLAIAVQATRGVIRIRQVWPWEGLNTTSVVVIGTLVVMTGMAVAILSMAPWLVSQPMPAGDEAAFDLGIRLRREQVSCLIGLLYGLAFSVGFVVDRIDTGGVPVEVRRQWPVWTYFLPLVVMMLAFAGLMVQRRLEWKWRPTLKTVSSPR